MARKALLILQGGGALGAFQCGAYRAVSAYLRERDIELAGIAGASIGAVNAAVIAARHGDPDLGAGALAAFWRDRLALRPQPLFPVADWYHHCWNGLLTMLIYGHPGLGFPNYLAWGPVGSVRRAEAGLHDPQRMREALAQMVGRFGPNPGKTPLLLVRAVDAETQQPVIFHSWQQAVDVPHLVASASIPFLYPLGEIDGRAYWDGDFLPYSPFRDLLRVLREQAPADGRPHDYLVIVVDTVCGERHKPQSSLDLLYQVQAGLLEPRADWDEEYARLNNRYVDFLTVCAGAVDGDTGAALARPIAEARRQAAAERLGRLEVVRIRRPEALLFEYVSRDLDYSRERLERLIDQGERQARRVLRAQDGAGAALPKLRVPSALAQ